MKYLSPLLTSCLIGLTACPETDPGATTTAEAATPEGATNSNPNNQSWRCTEDCALLKGTLLYEGAHDGLPQLDFMVIHEGDQPPERKHAMPLMKERKTNDWEVKAPRSEVDGLTITVFGFIDLQGDGPSDGDPAGFAQEVVELTEESEGVFVADGFNVEVSDEPDICTFPGKNFGTATCSEEGSLNSDQDSEEPADEDGSAEPPPEDGGVGAVEEAVEDEVKPATREATSPPRTAGSAAPEAEGGFTAPDDVPVDSDGNETPTDQD